MRVNVYAEELTDRIEIISKTTPDGEFTGVRFYLELPVTITETVENCESGHRSIVTRNVTGPFMYRPGDDDSAAVTFWGKQQLRRLLVRAICMLDNHAGTKGPVPYDLPRPTV
jgi:hypothetical protein